MKKRILALALCLVMVVSLLPISAAAEGTNTGFVHVTGNGFVQNGSGVYILDGDSFTVQLNGADVSNYICESKVLFQDDDLDDPVMDAPADGRTYYLEYVLRFQQSDYTDEQMTVAIDQLEDALNTYKDCSLTISGYTTPYFDLRVKDGLFHIIFQVTKNHEHQWQYTVSESRNKLMATCTPTCNIGPVSLTISAQSVTLPNSPFKAELTFQGDFKEAFSYSDIEYKYRDSDGWKVVDPKTFTPKPGEYQAKVYIYGLPGNGEIAVMAVSNDDGTNQGGTEYLYVKFTASDPKVTAQTGDNRPIEIMMGSVLVFSALAAAAFLLDSKRRYRR